MIWDVKGRNSSTSQCLAEIINEKMAVKQFFSTKGRQTFDILFYNYRLYRNYMVDRQWPTAAHEIEEIIESFLFKTIYFTKWCTQTNYFLFKI